MADYGIKISQPGKSIASSDIRDYVLHSGFLVPKTYLVVTGSKSFTSELDTETNQTVLTVNHNLGYRPYCVYYYSLNNSEYGGSFWITSQGSPHLCHEYFAMNVTSTQFTIKYYYVKSGSGDGLTGITGYAFNFKAYIFIDRGEP